MADVIISPNMGLPVPVVSEEIGPDWAVDINACMSAIDSHNHSASQGVPVTPDGLNINADLPMNNQNVITARSVRFQPQTAALAEPSDLGCLYEEGDDLYYIDGAGNNIRITQSGSVTGSSGTITGLPSGTASASFAGGTFTFQSATSTPAAMDVGSVKVSQTTSGGFGVTLSANVGQASNYNMSLPAALPASQKIMTLDNSGNIGAAYDTDNVTLEVSSNNLQVKNGGITNVKLAAVNAVVTSSSGTFSTSSTGFTTVLTTSNITTVGRPVQIQFFNNASTQCGINSAQPAAVEFRIRRNGTDVSTYRMYNNGTGRMGIPPGCINTVDFPSGGTHAYELEARCVTGGNTVEVINVTMYVYEM